MTRYKNIILEQEAKDYLRKALNFSVQIDADALDSLVDLFEFVTYKKNHIIIEEGKIADHFYFIYKGLIKIYFYKNDKPVIDRFEIEGGLIGGNFTHLTKQPGTHIYESLEDIMLLKIKYTDLDELCKKSHDVERLYRINMELFHTNYATRLYTFKALSSEDRYHEFITLYGDVANRVPLKDIANYLGMTPETLSRIRARYDKSNK